MLLLGIETSCDETAAAVVADGGRILSNVVSSQIELHKPYGGVVPEIASRNHLQLMEIVVQDSLERAGVRIEELDAVAATYGPGLASSLLVGLTAAKGLAYSLGIPFIGINHLEAHLFSPLLNSDGGLSKRDPFVSLIVSGGHTILVYVRDVDDYEVLGQTVDDAAGEAFDKVAKLLGLGYPGGPEIDRIARNGNPSAIRFPRSLLDEPNFDFSFSGLKTAVLYHVRGVPESRGKEQPRRASFASTSPQTLEHLSTRTLSDLCASFQEAVVDVLVGKTIRAAKAKQAHMVTASGGVSVNSRFRARLTQECQRNGIDLFLAEPRLCTDNGAMIAALAHEKLVRGRHSDFTLDVNPNLALA